MLRRVLFMAGAVALAGAAAAEPLPVSPAAPDAGPRDQFVELRAGVYAPNTADVKYLGNGFDLEGALAERFTSWLAGDLAIGWYRAAGDGGHGSPEQDLSVITGTLSARPFHRIGRLDLYATGGLGVYSARLTVSSSLGSHGSSALTFGYHAGGGLSFQWTPRLAVGAELRYVWAEAKLFEQDVKIGGARIGATMLLGF